MEHRIKYFLLKRIDKINFYPLTLVLLFTVNFFSVSAQTIVKSATDKVANRFSDYEIIGKNDIGLIVHYFGSNESELVVYDDNLKIANRKELPFKGKTADLENILLLKDRILIFYSTDGDTYKYLKLKTLTKNLAIPFETVLLDSIPLASIGKGKAFYIKTSPDKSKIVLFNILKSSSTYFVRFTTITDSINIFTKSMFAIPNANTVSLKSLKINNEGNVTGVFGYENNSDEYNIDRYVTLSYNKSTNTIGEQVLQSQDYVYKNLITEVSNTKDIVYLTAAYKNTKNRNDIGIAYQIIDLRTNTILLNSKLPFTEDLLKKTQARELKAWQDKAALVKPKRIMPRSDGGFVVITESEYKTTRTERMETNNYGYYNATPYMPAMRYVNQNVLYDIGILSINTNGTLDWQATMPKSQVSENDDGYYSSFAFFESNNVLKFLYNEDFYNIGNFVEYNINANGITKRKSVMNSEKQGLVMVPLKAKQLDGRSIIIPSEQKRNLQFVLFQY
jgi:hypothetical protein